MDVLDWRKLYRELYSARVGRVQEVVVPAMKFAMVDGKSSEAAEVATAEFQNAINALYAVSQSLKYARKATGLGPDFVIGPLEALWWMDDGGEFDTTRPDDWRWTLMLLQPDFITPGEFEAALEQAEAKKSNPALALLRLEDFEEGRSVQTMHRGPYDKEGPGIQLLEDYAYANGLKRTGRHHEVYLGDPRRALPENLRTILRHPVR